MLVSNEKALKTFSSFEDRWRPERPRIEIQSPPGHQGTKVPVSALPDRRRRTVVIPVISPAAAQPQLAAVVPPAEARNVRPVPVVLELVAREVRSRSTVEPCERPVRELDLCRDDLACCEIVLTPQGVGTGAFAVFWVECQPDGTRVLTLLRREAQVCLIRLDAIPAVLGVARRGLDLVPKGVEAVWNVQKQHLGLRPGGELLGRLGQNGVRPELTRTRELLLGGTPPGDTGQLFDGGHDDPIPAVDFSDAICSGDLNCMVENGVLRAKVCT